MNPYELANAPPTFDASHCRSLYVGNLNAKITDELLHGIFSAIAPLESCKLIKDKNSGDSAGYGFVDYFDHHSAAIALHTLNGKKLYGNEIKVNWAFASNLKEDVSSHYHVFVGDLSPSVDDKALFAAFSGFGTISNARVMVDTVTGRSRGYGFIAFRTKEDAERALTEMNGEYLAGRAIRCNWANQKAATQDIPPPPPTPPEPAPPTNTTVYVGGLAPDVVDSALLSIFNPYGEIAEIRIQRDKGYAFKGTPSKTYQKRGPSEFCCAKAAIREVNGTVVGARPVKCSWGKEKPATAPPTQPPPPMWGYYQMPYQPYPAQYPPYLKRNSHTYAYQYPPPAYFQQPQHYTPTMYNTPRYDTQAYGYYNKKS